MMAVINNFSLIVCAVVIINQCAADNVIYEGKSNSANVPVVGRVDAGRARVKRGTSGSRLTYEERLEYLSVHNNFRKNVSPEASDMQFMVWDEDLADMAQEWADGCAFEHGQPARDPKPYSNIGQNLYYTTGSTATPTSCTTSWHNEVSDYTFSSNSCATDAVCGHYTQVIWASSSAVGCALTDCPSLSGTSNSASNYKYVVCNYGPAGNWNGQKPYTQGTRCSACPSGMTCESNLCVNDPKCSKTCNNGGRLDAESCECDCVDGGYNGESCDDGDSGGDGGDGGDSDNNSGHVNKPVKVLLVMACMMTIYKYLDI